jgi:hypothetical protein
MWSDECPGAAPGNGETNTCTQILHGLMMKGMGCINTLRLGDLCKMKMSFTHWMIGLGSDNTKFQRARSSAPQSVFTAYQR